MIAAAQIGRMPDAEKRGNLLVVPEFGRVTRKRGRIVLDFSPDLRGSARYLYSFAGKAFNDEAHAESVRLAICTDARHMPLEDAIARFKSQRSRVHQVSDVIDRFIKAAPAIPKENEGQVEFLRPRSVEAYKRVLNRAKPFWGRMTIAEATQAKNLRQFKAWFRIPKPEGRGLKTDQEARAAFGAFRACIAWYRTERPEFPEPNWPKMPTAAKAKGMKKPTVRLTLAQVVAGIDAIPLPRQPIFWAMFYTQARITEARGVLGEDWRRPVLTICRSAETKHAGAPIAPTTKTGETGSYTLPEWVCDLFDQHCTAARFDPSQPLFQNPSPLATPGTIGDQSIHDTWERASEKAGLPWVPPYRAFKHTQVTAMRDAGISIEEIVDQCRWTNDSMLEFYDERKDERRSGVVTKLDEMVEKARKAWE